MIYRLVNLLVKYLYKLRFGVLIEIFKHHYYLQKNNQLQKKFKSIGVNFSIGKDPIIINPQYINIGNNFQTLHNFRLEAWDEYHNQTFSPEISIGNNVTFNTDCHIGCINQICIGNNVLFASRIYISDHFHGEINVNALNDHPSARPLISKGPIFIDDDVWIGEGVCILPGVKIGKNAIIGANSVVTKDVPDNAVVAGIPAKILKLLIDVNE